MQSLVRKLSCARSHHHQCVFWTERLEKRSCSAPKPSAVRSWGWCKLHHAVHWRRKTKAGVVQPWSLLLGRKEGRKEGMKEIGVGRRGSDWWQEKWAVDTCKTGQWVVDTCKENPILYWRAIGKRQNTSLWSGYDTRADFQSFMLQAQMCEGTRNSQEDFRSKSSTWAKRMSRTLSDDGHHFNCN